MKRTHFYGNDSALANLRLARAYFFAYRAAEGFNSDPLLLGLYRQWMREAAKDAVKYAKAEAAR